MDRILLGMCSLRCARSVILREQGRDVPRTCHGNGVRVGGPQDVSGGTRWVTGGSRVVLCAQPQLDGGSQHRDG